MPRSSRRRSRRSIPLQYYVFFWVFIIPTCLLLALRSTYDNPLLLLLLVPPFLALVAYLLWRRWRRQRQIRLLEAQKQQRLAQEHAQEQERRWYEHQAEQRRFQYQLGLNDFTSLSAEEFERAVGHILEAYGYQNVRGTRRTGDRGVDLFAVSPQGESVVVQCKRFAPGKNVSDPELQKFLGAITHHRVQRGIFVTTSSYTKPAREYAQVNGIKLIDGQQLVTMMRQLRNTTPNRYLPS